MAMCFAAAAFHANMIIRGDDGWWAGGVQTEMLCPMVLKLMSGCVTSEGVIDGSIVAFYCSVRADKLAQDTM